MMKMKNSLFSASLVLSVLLAGIVFASYVFVLPPEIPLFYSLSRPQDRLIQKEYVFILPAVALFITMSQIPFLRLPIEHETSVRMFLLLSIFLILLLDISFARIFLLVT